MAIKTPREGKTYRFARRNGWRALNAELSKKGQPTISWAVFNQAQKFNVGSRASQYRMSRPGRGKHYGSKPQLSKGRRLRYDAVV